MLTRVFNRSRASTIIKRGRCGRELRTDRQRRRGRLKGKVLPGLGLVSFRVLESLLAVVLRHHMRANALQSLVLGPLGCGLWIRVDPE